MSETEKQKGEEFSVKSIVILGLFVVLLALILLVSGTLDWKSGKDGQVQTKTMDEIVDIEAAQDQLEEIAGPGIEELPESGEIRCWEDNEPESTSGLLCQVGVDDTQGVALPLIAVTSFEGLKKLGWAMTKETDAPASEGQNLKSKEFFFSK